MSTDFGYSDQESNMDFGARDYKSNFRRNPQTVRNQTIPNRNPIDLWAHDMTTYLLYGSAYVFSSSILPKSCYIQKADMIQIQEYMWRRWHVWPYWPLLFLSAFEIRRVRHRTCVTLNHSAIRRRNSGAGSAIQLNRLEFPIGNCTHQWFSRR